MVTVRLQNIKMEITSKGVPKCTQGFQKTKYMELEVMNSDKF